MSNYLGNLLERSFAPTQEVRPRIPSLFEPQWGEPLLGRPEIRTDAIESEISLSSRPGLVSSHAATLDISKPPNAELHEPSLAPKTLEIAQPDNSKHPASDRPIAVANKTATEQLRAPVIMASKTIDHLEAASPVTIPERTLADEAESFPNLAFPPKNDSPRPVLHHLKIRGDQRANPAPSVPRPIDSIERLSQPLSENALDRDLPVAPQRFAASHNLTEENEKNRVVHPVPPQNETIVRPALSGPRHEPVREPAHPVPASPPSIHVTIGRIEVRAVSPSTPARAQSKKEAAMSLDSYLKKRREGGRQ